jgi:hypothetical protein
MAYEVVVSVRRIRRQAKICATLAGLFLTFEGSRSSRAAGADCKGGGDGAVSLLVTSPCDQVADAPKDLACRLAANELADPSKCGEGEVCAVTGDCQKTSVPTAQGCIVTGTLTPTKVECVNAAGTAGAAGAAGSMSVAGAGAAGGSGGTAGYANGGSGGGTAGACTVGGGLQANASTPSSCNTGGGSSDGDPHLRTADGLGFDFQAAGEFVLSKNRTMTVQVRQAKYGAKPVSVNVAVAASIDGNRFGLYLACPSTAEVPPVSDSSANADAARLTLSTPLCKPRVMVGGAEVAIAETEPMHLQNGGQISRAGNRYIAVSRDQLSQFALTVMSNYLNIDVTANDATDPAVGLLRGPNGDPHDDIVTRDERILREPIRFREFYDVYAASWRVDASESLFDYGRGESTETFTDRAFPALLASVEYLPLKLARAAEATCRAAGVAEGYWLHACVLDVATTEDSSFANGFSSKREAVTPLALLDETSSAGPGGFPMARSVTGLTSTGDCRCSLPGARRPSSAALLLLVGASAAAFRRRRRSGEGMAPTTWAMHKRR